MTDITHQFQTGDTVVRAGYQWSEGVKLDWFHREYEPDGSYHDRPFEKEDFPSDAVVSEYMGVRQGLLALVMPEAAGFVPVSGETAVIKRWNAIKAAKYLN